MAMNFETIKAAIVQIYGDAEAGRYKTVGYQRQSKAAAEVLGDNRFIQVFYFSGDFPKSAAGQSGTKQHECTYRIELTAAASSKVDLTVFADGTEVQKAAALLAHLEATEEADKSIDELIRIAYQVIMDNENFDLGLPVGTISNRWVNNIQKDTPPNQGEYVIITASMSLTLKTTEEVTGDIGVTPDPVEMDTTIKYQEEQEDKTGVLASNTP